MPIPDMPKVLALDALARYRARYFRDHENGPNLSHPTPEVLEEVYRLVGGRLNFLSRVAKAEDMLAECRRICDRERTWLLNQCWILGPEMDDDVMEHGKYSSTAMVLAKALVDREKENRRLGVAEASSLPEIPLHEARQIMTRADYIQHYDFLNIFTIDSRAMVRADSVPMQNAFREICSQEGFDEHLEATLQRISDIESPGRTREIVAKDLIAGGTYRVRVERGKGDGKEAGSQGIEYVVGIEEPPSTK